MLRRYVLRLRPDDEQREAMEELYNEFRAELRNGIPSKDEREEMAAEFYEQVMELLDDEQKAQLRKYVGGDERRTRESPNRREDRYQSYDKDDAPDEEAEEGETDEEAPDEEVAPNEEVEADEEAEADEVAPDEEAGDEEEGQEEGY